MLKKWLRLRETRGQSLVEMALMLPVLLVMFAGLVEIGAALRDYLVLVNANREGVRFAARGRFFGSDKDVEAIFQRVVAAAGIEQRGDEFIQSLRPVPVSGLGANTTIAITYIEVPDQIDETGGLLDEPAIVNGPWYSGTLHYGDTRIQAGALAEARRQENKAFNQKYFLNPDTKVLDQPSTNDFVIVETWFDHEQLLKLPIFTEILPEKFALYSQSTMRVTVGRQLGAPEP